MSDVFYQVAGSPINQNNINLSFGYIIINGSWTEDVFTCTSINYLESFRKQMSKFALTDNVLTKTNTTSYTPTNDYNPSTKKYVDDAVANINIPMYTITTTKSFMDGYINFETDVINKMTEIVNKNLDTGFELYIVDMYGRTFRFDIQMRTPSDTSNSSTRVFGYGLGSELYTKVRKFIVQYSAKDGLYTFSQFISDGTQIVTFNNEVLTKDNTDVYTPTGNYNPATKKYVDDNVKTYTAGDNIKIDENNVISASDDAGVISINLSGLGSGLSILNADYPLFADAINKMITLNRIMPIAIYYDSTNSYNGIYIPTTRIISGVTFATFSRVPTYIASSYTYKLNGSLTIYLSWTDDKCSATNIIINDGKNLNISDSLLTSAKQTITGTHTYNTLPKSSVVPSDDTELVNKKYVDDSPTTYTGYDATKTQVLKNINGTLTWVNE